MVVWLVVYVVIVKVYVICVLTKFNSNIDPGSLNIAILPTSLHFFIYKAYFFPSYFFHHHVQLRSLYRPDK